MMDYVPTPRSDYSPDEIERNGEAQDYAEQEARQRTIDNSRHADPPEREVSE